MTKPTEGASQGEALKWPQDHAPFLASVVLFLLVVIRVLRVSGFDPATAATLVRESGLVTIALGALVGSLPALLVGAAFYLVILAMGGPGESSHRAAAWTAAVILWSLLTILLPWISLLTTTALLVVLVLVQRKLKWRLEYFAVLGFLSFLLLDQPRMWLPPENVAIASREPTVAYVLSVDSEWTTLLREDNRAIVIVENADVMSRTVCNLVPQASTRTIGQIVFGEQGGSRNPACPKG